ncbi:2-hydroxychromene-2-carboxylate isomerase [Mesobacterium pallidum]|uniref:2-hydroxychromene-2-carboxylate isomerase n=1 Tax=Mesobacterium pallidum TaxID=2872037 RepID=UPI001EE27214|nr:DsbA family protein [Mesobacterium pallidum]
MQPIEFWISVGSTYSYLTIARLDAVQRDTGAEVIFRPFSVREIMIEMDNVPFARKPVKAAYMWRDIERRAKGYGLAPKLPASYPLAQFDLANRVAVLAAREGWIADYLKATYAAWFEQGQPAGEPENLAASLAAAGQSMDRILAEAESDEIGAAYAAATQEARDRGIFGAPSFVCADGELFWGDDRFEEAIAWQKALG